MCLGLGLVVLSTALVLLACGDDVGADGLGGGGASSSSVGSGATAASTTSSTTGGGGGGGRATSSSGGRGGADGGGAEGGGGEGGAAYPGCVAQTARVAGGADFTCATGDDGTLLCRGGRFGSDWAAVAIEGDGDARCVAHVTASGSGLCFRTDEGAGCPEPGAWCAIGSATTAQRMGPGPLVAAIGDGACAFSGDGTASCAGSVGLLPSLAELEPVIGVDGGARDACAWGASRLLCWGDTPRIAAEVPLVVTCPVDVDVGDGFACLGHHGFDVVDCWGDRPEGVPERVFLAGPVEDVAVTGASVCARTTTGLVRCWGDDAQGTIGVEGDGSSSSPVTPSWAGGEAPNATGIAGGGGHIAIFAAVGGPRVLGWGRNAEAQVCACPVDLVDTPEDAEFPLP